MSNRFLLWKQSGESGEIAFVHLLIIFETEFEGNIDRVNRQASRNSPVVCGPLFPRVHQLSMDREAASCQDTTILYYFLYLFKKEIKSTCESPF